MLATAPLALLISGCGSGGGGGLIGGQTATPIPTATETATATPTGTTQATATPTTAPQQTSNITLGNGQRAILKTTSSGNKVTGTIQILTPSADARRGTRALNFAIKVGTYQISGTFTPPRGYNFSVADGGQTLFSMSGLFATATQTGTYTLIAQGQTETGIIPKIGTPFPTTTATPAPTVNPGTGGFVSNLTFTPSNGSNFVGAPLTSAPFTLVSSANIIGAVAQSDVAAGKGGVFARLRA